MTKEEILILYGSEYKEMAVRLAGEADLAGMILEKMKRTKPQADPYKADILLKPNLVAPVMAFEGATTHPEIVEGIICYLKDAGFKQICIAESSWVGDRTEDAFDLCGYYKLAEKNQVELIDMKKEPVLSVDCNGMELKVGARAVFCDFLINIPVLKGHCQTRMTCALKNMKGILPDSEKRAFHRMGLHEPIGHLSAGICQDFILVDSICGDLSFEDGGHPVRQDRMMAAADPVLLDSYCAGLLQIPENEIAYIGIAQKAGAGSNDLERANIRELNEPVCERKIYGVGTAVRLQEIAQDVESCSACFAGLMPALLRLEEEGLFEKLSGLLGGEKIAIGQGYKGKSGRLGIGSCTKNFEHCLKGCPPHEDTIYEFLKGYILSDCVK